MRDYLCRLGYGLTGKGSAPDAAHGLQSVAPKPNTSHPVKQHKTYLYLLKGMTIDRPNQVWCTDITYIRLAKGFVYLVVVMDWYSRKVKWPPYVKTVIPEIKI